MSRFLRIYLLGCIAVTFGYLLVHAREPLRLNVGDPWSDAEVMLSVPHGGYADGVDPGLARPAVGNPLQHGQVAEAVYRTIGGLGVGGIGTFRMLALAFSAVGTGLLFLWARRIWGDTIALLGTTLWTANLLWMMYADSLQQPPIVHASCFLALWGLVRALETRQLRHYAATLAGTTLCLLAGLHHWVFLPAAMLFTIYRRLGNPFARGNRRFVLLCAAGGVVALLLKARLGVPPVDWKSSLDDQFAAPLATLVRRYTLAFTPMFWITLGCVAWRVVRAGSVYAVIDDGVTWMLAAAVVFFYWFSDSPVSPVVRAQPLLPFYAFGSAILIARLLGRGRIMRALGSAWAIVAPLWAFCIMLSHPRSVLEPDEVARVNAYLAQNDRNDFVMSNLLSEGPIQTAFDRHSWSALVKEDADDVRATRQRMLEQLEAFGTDYLHALIFTTPDSRFVDRSLGQLLGPRRLPSVMGWPYLTRRRADQVIREYDRKVADTLEAVGARRVLHLSNFDVYRIDRATVRELAARAVPVARLIDFSSFASNRFKLMGWGNPWVTPEEHLGVSTIDGYLACPNPLIERGAGELAFNACESVPTPSGLNIIDVHVARRAELMIRVERACDLRLTFQLASWSLLRFSINDFTAMQCDPGEWVSFIVPARAVKPGVNILSVERIREGTADSRVDVMSLAIEPMCEPVR
ncbi:MAG TPA: glycosyltransferase family 39 protein [Kofleriaceae bacterium]|nr:glycosyltransferase family 39 protein [Kofleriaceae bacterium]